MKKRCLSLFLAIGLLFQTLPFSFADDFSCESFRKESQHDKTGDTLDLVTPPSSWEYKYRDINLNLSQLEGLRTRADEAYRTNDFSSKVGLVSFVTGLCGEPLQPVSLVTGFLSYMVQSELDPYLYYTYATRQYETLMRYPQLKQAEGHFTFKRCFYGETMTPWFPTSVQ